MSFRDKKCIVTGGTKGIGRAIVQAFAEQGAEVYTCSRTKNDLNALIDELTSAGYNVKVSKEFDGRLDILINNAGTAVANDFLDVKHEEYEFILDTNLRSLAYPLFKANDGGSVVMISSVAGGHRTVARGSVYSMSKAALDNATKSLACEWAKDNIRVNGIAPGMIKTPLSLQYIQQPDFLELILSETPMRRVGQAQEIAGPTLFLCSPSASFITGVVMTVDGGYSVRGLGN